MPDRMAEHKVSLEAFRALRQRCVKYDNNMKDYLLVVD